VNHRLCEEAAPRRGVHALVHGSGFSAQWRSSYGKRRQFRASHRSRRARFHP